MHGLKKPHRVDGNTELYVVRRPDGAWFDVVSYGMMLVTTNEYYEYK